jgi:hypothetical protein
MVGPARGRCSATPVVHLRPLRPGRNGTAGLGDLDPDPTGQALGVVSWWVVDWLVDSPVERALNQLVPAWIATDWPQLSVPRAISWRTGR